VNATASVAADIQVGASCAINGTMGACVADSLCYTATPTTALSTCQNVAPECPNDYTVQTLTQGNNQWTYTGNNSTSTIMAQGSCASDSNKADVIEFTAPSAGVYSFVISASDVDTLIFGRKYCSLDLASQEVGCNDDYSERLSGFEAELSANQMIYVFVTGYDSESLGAYTLTVTQGNLPAQK